MRRTLILSVITMIGAFTGGQALPIEVERPEFLDHLQVEIKRLVIRADGSLASEQSFGFGRLGSVTESNVDPADPIRLITRSGMGLDDLSPCDWEEKGRIVLRSTFDFIEKKGIMLHLTWLRDGEVTGSEDVLMEDFDPISRILFSDERSGTKTVLRFTPLLKKKYEAGPAHLDWEGPILRGRTMLARGGARGEKIFANIPGTGFFQFSLNPFPGAKPEAKIQGSVLTFQWQGESYEWYGKQADGIGKRVYMLASEAIPAGFLKGHGSFDAANVAFGATNID